MNSNDKPPLPNPVASLCSEADCEALADAEIDPAELTESVSAAVFRVMVASECAFDVADAPLMLVWFEGAWR